MRFLSKRRGAAVMLPLVATLSCVAAQAAVNIVPAEVRLLSCGEGVNQLFVDVTVCDVKERCRTVPDVLVDTGSSGLRLFRPALKGLELEAVTVLHNRPLGDWVSFGSGELWATLHWAWVRMGGLETTEAIPIELFDSPSPGESLPAGYGGFDMRAEPATTVGNGILGIAARRYHHGRYYMFTGDGGALAQSDWERVMLDESAQLANPIGYFPEPYNNGSVISLPEVDAGKGQKAAQGWLGFGIGQPTAMLFPEGRRVITHELDQHGKFPVRLSERPVEVMLDSGSTVIHLDLDPLGFTRHKSLREFYDPAVLTPVDLTVISAGQEIKLARALQVGPADNVEKADQGYAVLPMLATWHGPDGVVPGEPEDSLLGLPFFFGRAVATGLQGTVNPFAPRMPQAAPATLPEEGRERVTHSPNGFVAYTD